MSCLLQIAESDSLFRGVHFPKAFAKPETIKAFDPSRFTHLGTDRDAKAIISSVVWQRLAPFECDVHAYGCRLAHRRTLAGTNDVYCGAYQVTLERIKTACTSHELPELKTIDALHAVEEDGEIAHANLRFKLVDDFSGSYEELKTIFADAMWRSSRGPLKHVCAKDEALTFHPSEKLIEPALGEFLDARSVLVRLRMLVGAQIRKVCWRLNQVTAKRT